MKLLNRFLVFRGITVNFCTVNPQISTRGTYVKFGPRQGHLFEGGA